MKINFKLSIMIIFLCLVSLSNNTYLKQSRFQLSDKKSKCSVRFDYVDNSSSTFKIAGSCMGKSFSAIDLNECIGYSNGMFIRTKGFKNNCSICSVNKEDNYSLKCWCKQGVSRWYQVKVRVLTMFAWNQDKKRVECF